MNGTPIGLLLVLTHVLAPNQHHTTDTYTHRLGVKHHTVDSYLKMYDVSTVPEISIYQLKPEFYGVEVSL